MQIYILQEDRNKLEELEDEVETFVPFAPFGASEVLWLPLPEYRGDVERGTTFWDRMPLREEVGA